MKLYHILQTVVESYDTFSDAVVAAENEQQARETHPASGLYTHREYRIVGGTRYYCYGSYKGMPEDEWYPDNEWCPNLSDVTVIYLGEATKGISAGVICASFHAG